MGVSAIFKYLARLLAIANSRVTISAAQPGLGFCCCTYSTNLADMFSDKTTNKKLLIRIYKNLDRLYGRFSIIRHGFWFVDIPRTSSSSIRLELSKRFGRAYGKKSVIDEGYATAQIFPDHMPAREMLTLLGESKWKSIFTFTMVRNPWDRTYSSYNYRQKTGSIPKELGFREYVLALGAASADSEFFSYHGYRDGASDYILGVNGEIIVDFIAKYENRSCDIKLIASRLNLDEFGELHIQKATMENRHYSRFYDSEMREVVGKLYAKDIELFDYEFVDR